MWEVTLQISAFTGRSGLLLWQRETTEREKGVTGTPETGAHCVIITRYKKSTNFSVSAGCWWLRGWRSRCSSRAWQAGPASHRRHSHSRQLTVKSHGDCVDCVSADILMWSRDDDCQGSLSKLWIVRSNTIDQTGVGEKWRKRGRGTF